MTYARRSLRRSRCSSRTNDAPRHPRVVGIARRLSSSAIQRTLGPGGATHAGRASAELTLIVRAA
jgi:hypothetical protein